MKFDANCSQGTRSKDGTFVKSILLFTNWAIYQGSSFLCQDLNPSLKYWITLIFEFINPRVYKLKHTSLIFWKEIMLFRFWKNASIEQFKSLLFQKCKISQSCRFFSEKSIAYHITEKPPVTFTNKMRLCKCVLWFYRLVACEVVGWHYKENAKYLTLL